MINEVLGTHIGKRNGLEYGFTIIGHETCFRVRALQRGFSIGVYYANKNSDSHTDEKCFLDLAGMDPCKAVYKSSISIEPFHQLEGLSRVMFNFLVAELQRREVIHWVGFSDTGKERMRHKFLAVGYEPVNVKKGYEDDYCHWLAKEY